jgi:AcrR family transcriptional regulator
VKATTRNRKGKLFMPANSTPDHTPDETSQRIIIAAMQLFGQVGYSQATTRSIAEAAGVNEVTLFRHFGSKKNLLIACIDSFNATSFAAKFETGLTGDYSEDIWRMALLQIEDTTAHLEILRLLMCDARNVPELREAILAGGRGNLARLSRYFQGLIDTHVIRPGTPAEILAVAFDSLFSSNVIFENLFQGSLSPRLPSQEVVHQLVDLFVRGTQLDAR